MKKYALAAATAALLSTGAPAHAQDASQAALRTTYWHLDDLCRSGSGDAPDTIKACDQRNVVGAQMRKLFNLCILTAEGDFEDCNTPVPSDDDDTAAAKPADTPAQNMLFQLAVCTRLAGYPQGDTCFPMSSLSGRSINGEEPCKAEADYIRRKMPQLSVQWHDQNGDWTRSIACYEKPTWTQVPQN
jgi:hypothetical protein